VSLHSAMPNEPVDFLRQKSGVYKSRMQAAQFADLLIVDDSALDARAIGALLRSAFGRDADVRHAASLMRAKNMLLERMPQLIVLDDVLPPKDRAEGSIAYLRQSGFAGPVIVVSGEMNRHRRLSILAAGASGVIHKDDLNATSLAEAVSEIGSTEAFTPGEPDGKKIQTSGDDII
jgi:DNA-binding NarL/FixJ family response regulator